ncbi:MAG: extracellular solute-binding protein [Saccharothrix sp.]|nr:extracellular solute-binding protein [Saccharothrix sp.]
MGMGDIPEWISAFATLFALVFAASAVVVNRRTYRIESARDRVSAEQRERRQLLLRQHQAALVSAWWGELDGRRGAFVRNASQTPVHQVYLTVLNRDDRSDGVKFYFPVVPPSEEPVFCSAGAVPIPAGTAAFRVKLCFTDASGVRWLRNQYGRITELEPTLRVKSDSARSTALSAFKDDFNATYGADVTFDTSSLDAPQERFVRDLARSSEVDAMVCPHDWIGDLVARDLVESMVLADHHRDLFHGWTLSALTVDGKLYGMPTTVDTVALWRNTRLAPAAPRTFDELIAHGRALKEDGRVDEVLALRVGAIGDPFQVWPLFTSAGGWVFRRSLDGTWLTDVIGLDSPESVRAFARLRELGEQGSGLLRRSIGRDEAFDLFRRGRTPYLISTSDAFLHVGGRVSTLAVGPVPAFSGGAAARGFSLVHGFHIKKGAKNKVVAQDLFADYLTHEHVMSALSGGTGAPTALRGLPAVDPLLGDFYQLCERADPMPTHPRMGQIWRVIEEAEVSAVAGEPADRVARDAAARVAALVRG